MGALTKLLVLIIICLSCSSSSGLLLAGKSFDSISMYDAKRVVDMMHWQVVRTDVIKNKDGSRFVRVFYKE